MFWTQTFIPTLKEPPEKAETISHKLMLRAGLIRMLTSGVYSYLPLGLKVLRQIEMVVREELKKTGAEEILLPVLQPIELWKQTDRINLMEQTLICFTDRRGRDLCLGPTHEEVITDLIRNHIQSYRQLPLVLYQIQTKFRDEPRPRSGVIRSCEFIMKDAYSFDLDNKGLEKNYKLMFDAYNKIFKRLNLDYVSVKADPGFIGGNLSHEFMVLANGGEDKVIFCPVCRFATNTPDKKYTTCPKCQKKKLVETNTIEVGHIFQLGTKYSKALKATYLDREGKQQFIIMGCYGIGISRLIAAIAEQHNDSAGLIWPKEASPYEALIIPLNINNAQIKKISLKILEDLEKEGVDVLFDDRDERAGVKFNDADLIGIPYQIIIGQEGIESDKLQIVKRASKEKILVDKNRISSELIKILKGR